jgi:hypothetical protein
MFYLEIFACTEGESGITGKGDHRSPLPGKYTIAAFFSRDFSDEAPHQLPHIAACALPVKGIAGLRTLWYLLDTNYSIRGRIMNREIFSNLRAKLGKTQKALAGLLGVSLKAVQSYEQGWRSIPVHVERQLYFLAVSKRSDNQTKRKDCWTVKKCDQKKECPAWEFQAGHLCWFLSGTLCQCTADKNWKEKMTVCRDCEVLTSLL